MSLGTVLKQLLEKNNISQKKLAQDLNIAPSTLGNYIRSIREPDFDVLVSFADYFNVSVDFLLGHKTNESSKNSHDEDMLLYMYNNMSQSNKHYFLEIGKVLINKKQNI